MKYFWIIFSSVVFFLSVLPCCDEGKVETKAGTAVLAMSADAHANESHEHQVCSPFCACACCGCHGCNIDAVQGLNITASFIQEPSYKINRYTFQFVTKFEANIWQPPRLG